MTVEVTEDANGKVSEVSLDTVVTDPDSDEAVQVPEEADGTKEDPLAGFKDPTPEEVFAAEAKGSSKGSSKAPAKDD